MRQTYLSISCFLIAGLIACVSSQTTSDLKNLKFKQWWWINQNVVVILTTDGALYRGQDGGSFIFPLNVTGVTDVIQDKVKPQMLYMNADTPMITYDGGLLTTPVPGKATARTDFKPHPTTSGYMLGATSSACWFTADFGLTWTRIYRGEPTQCQWGLQSRSEKVEAEDPKLFTERVFLVDDGALFYSKQIQNATFRDSGLTNVDEIFFVGEYLYIMTATKKANKLWISKDAIAAENITFSAVSFPDKDMDLTFLDDSNGGIWLASKINANSGILYTSGYEGTVFTQALANVNRQDGFFDFQNIGGIGGIFVVNQHVNRQIQSQITFNNGGSWRLLTAPLTDYNGNVYNCSVKDGCGLHLFMNEQDFSPIVTSENSVSLVIASGNVGKQLDTTFARTYVSRDAGLTWHEVMNISTAYAIGNHGGLITFIDNYGTTNYFWYSMDQGETLQQVNFTTASSAIKMKTIMSDPFAIRPSFVITTKTQVFNTDFSALLKSNCTENDFEPWVPTDGDESHGHCILGVETTYSRLIRNQSCINAGARDRILATKKCACEMNDYECDFQFTNLGFNASTNMLACVWDGVDQDPSQLPTNCTPGDSYTLSRGYKFVAGDRCDVSIGLDLLPKTVVCQAEPTTSSSTVSDASSSSTSSSTSTGKILSSTTSSSSSTTADSDSSSTTKEGLSSTTVTGLLTASSSSSTTSEKTATASSTTATADSLGTSTGTTTEEYAPASESSETHENIAVMVGVPLGIFTGFVLTIVFVAFMLGKLKRRRANLHYSLTSTIDD